MAVELPDELIVEEILSILPAKSLLQCRLVCKSWLSFINSTEFKLMHFHNFNQLNPRYFVRRLDHVGKKECYDVHLDDESFTLDRSTQIEFPFDRIRLSLCFRIVGCCNGVYCLYDHYEYGFILDTIILWNPSIRRKLTLPLPKFYSILSFVVLGFGYDNLSDDYKVVYLAYHSFDRPCVQVYALKTGNWREVLFPDNLLCSFIFPYGSRVFFNWFVHWIASDRRRGHNSIMTFDTSTELFGEIMLPGDLVEVHPSTIMISVVGESLGVTYYYDQINWEGVISSTYKTWVMKEYKNPTSWTLIYNMHYPDVDMGEPLKLRNKGGMITKSGDGNMIVYNYNGYASCIGLGYESEMDCWTYVDKYQESLALLDVGHTVSK